MTRNVLALLALSASTAAAQFPPQIIYGHPLPARPNGPTLPLRQPVQLPKSVAPQPRRNIRYVPAPMPYYYYGQYGQQSAPQQNVEVNVTNVIETPPQMPINIFGSVATTLTPGQLLANGLRIWDADADLAAERAATSVFADFDPDRADRRAADAEDVKSLESIVNALYDVLSGPRGAPRNWDRFRGLFTDGAHLITTRTEGNGVALPTVMTPDAYAAAAAPVLERGVFQREVSRAIERFGAIAHVFSTYECRRTSSDTQPYQRGINSIQLMNDGKRWWIMSVSWDAERPDNPIPAKYLPAPAPAKRN